MFKPNIEKMKAKRDVPGLVKALFYNRDVMIQIGAARALGEIGDGRALEPLVESLRDITVAGAAIAALGRLRDPKAVPGLGAVLQHMYPSTEDYSPHVEIREAAIAALARIGNKEAIGFIVRALEDKTLKVRVAASDELTRLGWQPEDERTRLLFDAVQAHTLLRRGRWNEIGERWRLLPPQAVYDLLNASSREARCFAVRTLGNMGKPDALASLLKALEDEDILVVIDAVKSLGKLGDPGAITPILRAYGKFVRLGQSSYKWADFRKQIVNALVAIGEPGMPALQDHLTDEQVIAALGQIRGEKAIDLLLRVVETASDSLRVAQAAYYLSELKEQRAVAPLRAVLKQEAHASRWDEVAGYLADLGDPSVAGDVVAVLPAIVARSISTLRFGGHPHAVHALVKIGEPAREPLLSLLADASDRWLREEIEWALQEMGAQSTD